ncbi:MAG: tripartite tricarboxylate transporter TctB family protein [Pseudomonadota bacterium]
MALRALETAVGAGVLASGGLLAAGAVGISGEAGYGGVGPNFLPWLVAGFLLACGAFLVWEAASGGFRAMDEPEGAAEGHWQGFAWVSAGLLANAALITTIGFVLSCGLCFALAVRGFRSSQGQSSGGVRGWLVAAATGVAISAPVYWMFSKLLAINLPGLTSTGWL